MATCVRARVYVCKEVCKVLETNTSTEETILLAIYLKVLYAYLHSSCYLRSLVCAFFSSYFSESEVVKALPTRRQKHELRTTQLGIFVSLLSRARERDREKKKDQKKYQSSSFFEDHTVLHNAYDADAARCIIYLVE